MTVDILLSMLSQQIEMICVKAFFKWYLSDSVFQCRQHRHTSSGAHSLKWGYYDSWKVKNCWSILKGNSLSCDLCKTLWHFLTWYEMIYGRKVIIHDMGCIIRVVLQDNEHMISVHTLQSELLWCHSVIHNLISNHIVPYIYRLFCRNYFMQL